MDEKTLTLKQKILRTTLVVLLLAALFGAIYLLLVVTGLWENINSVQKLKNFILSLGFWGRSAFVLLQFLQVTFIPLPSVATVVAGALVYGPAQASLLSLAGILLGSAFAFFLGRVFGRKLVNFMVGKSSSEKWIKFLNGGKYSFAIMMILPLFPDDLLCLVAGLTDMSWLFFMTTQFIARPLGIYLTSYFSSGKIIPYHGWGLVFWIAFGVFAIVSIILATKYKTQIENAFARFFHRKRS